MILLSDPISDSSTFSHTTTTFSPCSTENTGVHSAHLCSPFLQHLLLIHLLGWCVPWGGGITLACLALKSSKWFDSYKGSAGNPICFLTREAWLCWSEIQPAKQGSADWNSVDCAGGSSWKRGTYLIMFTELFIEVQSGKVVFSRRETAFSRKC